MSGKKSLNGVHKLLNPNSHIFPLSSHLPSVGAIVPHHKLNALIPNTDSGALKELPGQKERQVAAHPRTHLLGKVQEEWASQSTQDQF